MNNPLAAQPIPIERVETLIHLARGEKVLLDADLARLYGVGTKNLNKAVQRNLDRFPADFMFQLTAEEAESLRFQFGTLIRGQHVWFDEWVLKAGDSIPAKIQDGLE